MRKLSSGGWLLTATAMATATGGPVADWNRTHLFNPAWTPHAKFHDGWTIGLAAAMGATALYLLLGRRPAEPGLAAALLAQVWGTQGMAYAFPDAAGIAREFPNSSDRPGLTRMPEWAASTLMLALIAAGYGLDRRAHRRAGPWRRRRRIPRRA
jgi:hypothetical protein